MLRFVSIFAALTLFLSPHLHAQPLAPYGVSQLATDDAVLVYWFYPHVNDSVLALVDEDPNSYYLYSAEEVGARLASCFDLPAGPCAIAAIELRLWPTDPFPQYTGDQYSPFGLSLHSTLSTDVASKSLWDCVARRTVQETNDWLHIPVGKSVESDSVVMVFRWIDGSPTAPLPAIVFRESYLNNYDGHVEHDRIVWRKMYDSAVLARLIINQPDISAPPASGSEMPDSFSIFIFDSPGEEDSATSQILTISDSLHVSIAGGTAAGKYVAVAAWKEGLISAKSEIVRVDVSTDLDESVSLLPAIAMKQNFPNPFNAETVILSTSAADIHVFDLLGRLVARRVVENVAPDGHYRFRWNGRDDAGNTLPSGVYFYRQPGTPGVRKMILLK
jgi:hypothetical protein